MKTWNMPAGEYVVCDACYVIPQGEWKDIIEEYFKAEKSGTEQFVYKGQIVLFLNTEHGDGTYDSNKGQNISVDSGLICCVPKSLCDQKEMNHLIYVNHAAEITSKTSFECKSENGVLIFDDIVIDTNWEDEEYYDYEDEEYYDEEDEDY